MIFRPSVSLSNVSPQIECFLPSSPILSSPLLSGVTVAMRSLTAMALDAAYSPEPISVQTHTHLSITMQSNGSHSDHQSAAAGVSVAR